MRVVTKVTIFIALMITFAAWNTELLYAQSGEDSPYVYLIICSSGSKRAYQTGFKIKGYNGIHTALHGVSECDKIDAVSAVNNESFLNLEISEADIARDIALLHLTEDDSAFPREDEGEPPDFTVSTDNLDHVQRIYARGHPSGIDAQLKTVHLTLHNPISNRIISRVPEILKPAVRERNSPDPTIPILSIEGLLVSGSSGSPIYSQDNSVIGIAIGAIGGGISWAIPLGELNMSPRSEISDLLDDLKSRKDSNTGTSAIFTFINASIPPENELLLTITFPDAAISEPITRMVSLNEPNSYLLEMPQDVNLTGLSQIIVESDDFVANGKLGALIGLNDLSIRFEKIEPRFVKLTSMPPSEGEQKCKFIARVSDASTDNYWLPNVDIVITIGGVSYPGITNQFGFAEISWICKAPPPFVIIEYDIREEGFVAMTNRTSLVIDDSPSARQNFPLEPDGSYETRSLADLESSQNSSLSDTTSGPQSSAGLDDSQDPSLETCPVGKNERGYIVQAGDTLSGQSKNLTSTEINSLEPNGYQNAQQPIMYYNNLKARKDERFSRIEKISELRPGMCIYGPTPSEVSAWYEKIRTNPVCSPGGVASGPIQIAGSVSLETLTQFVITQINTITDTNIITGETRIDVGSFGTKQGFAELCSVKPVDIIHVDRAMTEAEIVRCQNIDQEPIEFPVGVDALVIVVNVDDAHITEATKDELKALFSYAEKWSDVNPEWPSERISRHLPSDGEARNALVQWLFDGDSTSLDGASIEFESADMNRVARSTEIVSNSIGLISASVLQNYQGSLSPLKIRAAEDQLIELNHDTIVNGSYPLTHEIYIYSTRQRMENYPAVEALLGCYLDDMQNKIVDAGYYPSAKRANDAIIQFHNNCIICNFEEIFPVAPPPVCQVRDPTGPDITVVSDLHNQTLTQAVIDRFIEAGFEGNINIEKAEVNFDEFCRMGIPEAVTTARYMVSDERTLCRNNGREPLEIEVSINATVVVVNKQNGFLYDATIEELQSIFSSAQYWSDVNAQWPHEPIQRILPPMRSDLRSVFVQQILGGDDEALVNAPGKIDYTDNPDILASFISDNEFAIAFVDSLTYSANTALFRALAIVGDDGPIELTTDNVINGQYPLTHPIYLYVTEEVLQRRPEFTDFVGCYQAVVQKNINTSDVYEDLAANISENPDQVVLLDSQNNLITFTASSLEYAEWIVSPAAEGAVELLDSQDAVVPVPDPRALPSRSPVLRFFPPNQSSFNKSMYILQRCEDC